MGTFFSRPSSDETSTFIQEEEFKFERGIHTIKLTNTKKVFLNDEDITERLPEDLRDLDNFNLSVEDNSGVKYTQSMNSFNIAPMSPSRIFLNQVDVTNFFFPPLQPSSATSMNCQPK